MKTRSTSASFPSVKYHYFHIDHNAPCLPPPPPSSTPLPPSPPKKMLNPCLQFLLGRLGYPGEIGNNSYAKFWGKNKVHYGLCENSE